MPISPVIDWTKLGLACGKYFPVSGIPTQLLVLHSAECPLQAGFAQSLTKWALQPGYPEASWHRFIDPLSRLRMIPDWLGAWTQAPANHYAIGWEQAGYAGYTRAQWTTVDGMKQLENLAFDMAEVAIRDKIPAVWLTTTQVNAVINGNRTIRGFCTHAQISPANRTDPGRNYPYDLLMTAVKKYIALLTAPKKLTGTIVGATEVNQVKQHINAVCLGPYSWPDENGNLVTHEGGIIRDIVSQVWAEEVRRSGGNVASIQELADAKTIATANAARLVALDAKLVLLDEKLTELIDKPPAPVCYCQTPPPPAP